MASLIAEPGSRWRIEFTGLDGNRKRVRLGRMRDSAASSFKERLEHLLEDLAGGGPSSDSRRWLDRLADQLYARLGKMLPVQRRVSVTLGELRKQFMESRKGLESESRRKLEKTFDHLVESFGEARLLREINGEHATEWRTWLEQPNRRLATVKTHVGNARTIFAWAVKSKLIVESPFEHQRGGSTPSDSLTFVPWESVELVLRKIKSPDLRLRVALCRYAGLRVDSEPPRLRWSEHVDFEGRMLRVPCRKTQRYTGKSVRVVPIDDRLLSHLQLRHRLKLADDDRVCQIGKLTGTHKATVEASIKRAGVARWPKLFQALRASYSSELRANGVPTDFASKMTGHSAEVDRRHYTAIPEKLLQWVASMYSPEKQAARKAAHRGVESVGTVGKNPDAERRKALEIEHFAALAGIGGNGWEMGDEGLEPSPRSANRLENRAIQDVGGAESGALSPILDPVLLQVIDRWPALSARKRRAVLGIVRASVGKVRAQGKRQGTGESRTSSAVSAAGGLTQCGAGRGAAFGRGAPGVFPERPVLENL